MGLSASQTRYLSLTARKSNVEFQGQQINQARTGLANQSADLYTEMMNLKAPTAPSVYDYIINPATLPIINWNSSAAVPTDDEDLKKLPTWPLNKVAQKNFEIYYAANLPSFQSFDIPEYTQMTDDKTGETYWCRLTYDKDRKPVYGDTHYKNKEDIPGTYCTKETGYDFAGTKVGYTTIHVSPDENFTYDKKTNTFNPKDGVSNEQLAANIQAYNFASGLYSKYSKPNQYAIYDHALSVEEHDQITNSNNQDDGDAVGYQRSATVNINQAQFDAAMVKYQEENREYEEELERINAKTDEIHEADKKLELQLKQLDTEQEAIQTEMEAVKKVIDKNIEQTFKSFA